MKMLIVEDEYSSRNLLQKYLANYGKLDFAVNGEEAVQAFVLGWKDKQPYDAIFLDIMMPGVDGQEALLQIRDMEKEMGVGPDEEVKIIMTTALSDPKNVIEAYYRGGATSYLAKPITKEKLLEELTNLGLIS